MSKQTIFNRSPTSSNNRIQKNPFATHYLNKIVRVIEEIKPGRKGRIQLDGVFWRAKSMHTLHYIIPKDTLVSIIGRHETTLLVKPLYNPQSHQASLPAHITIYTTVA